MARNSQPEGTIHFGTLIAPNKAVVVREYQTRRGSSEPMVYFQKPSYPGSNSWSNTGLTLEQFDLILQHAELIRTELFKAKADWERRGHKENQPVSPMEFEPLVEGIKKQEEPTLPSLPSAPVSQPSDGMGQVLDLLQSVVGRIEALEKKGKKQKA